MIEFGSGGRYDRGQQGRSAEVVAPTHRAGGRRFESDRSCVFFMSLWTPGTGEGPVEW
ncbi:hypothetical protein SSAG_06841 [Streptomyces sp. Mg1]|nr:hypothetical protein SSAG_06841 [Streptomyces sp. Mg1]